MNAIVELGENHSPVVVNEWSNLIHLRDVSKTVAAIDTNFLRALLGALINKKWNSYGHRVLVVYSISETGKVVTEQIFKPDTVAWPFDFTGKFMAVMDLGMMVTIGNTELVNPINATQINAYMTANSIVPVFKNELITMLDFSVLDQFESVNS